jgi:hypothetical protein
MKNRKIILQGSEYTLGKEYKDTLLKSIGIATAGITYLTGCDQLCLTWTDNTGRPVESWIDVTRIEEYIKPKPVYSDDVFDHDADRTGRGGPQPNLPEHLANDFGRGDECSKTAGNISKDIIQ